MDIHEDAAERRMPIVFKQEKEQAAQIIKDLIEEFGKKLGATKINDQA